MLFLFKMTIKAENCILILFQYLKRLKKINFFIIKLINNLIIEWYYINTSITYLKY